MGLCHASLNRHDEAARALEQAAVLQPLSPYPWYHLGMAYHTLDNRKKVDEVIAHLNTFDPKVTRKLINDTTSAGTQQCLN